MKLDNLIWNDKTYDEFLSYLDSLSEEKYKRFHQSLVLDGKPIRGIRTPLLKYLAKEIVKGDFKSFLELNKMSSYEEIILYGLVVSNSKIPFLEQLAYLDYFISYIDNWAINDIVCGSLKSFKKYQNEGFIAIKKYLNDSNPWSIRFGLVLLLGYYINDNYINEVLDIANNITSSDYYVKMANSWLISICYIKYKEETALFLRNTKIDNWTYNKAISKMCDSKRVGEADKTYLKSIKKK